MVFALEGMRFALPGSAVREVVRATAVAPLPDAPGVVEGVIDYRGLAVPVLGARVRFGLPRLPLDPSQHFIVADAGGRTVALRVDRALDTLDLPSEDWTAAVDVAPGGLRSPAVARLADGLVVIHDLTSFLSGEESIRLDRALADDEATPPKGIR